MPDRRLESIGEALRALREGEGVALREQARRLDISHTRLGRLEREAADVRIGTIAGYVAALEGELSVSVTMPDGRVIDLLEAGEGTR